MQSVCIIIINNELEPRGKRYKWLLPLWRFVKLPLDFFGDLGRGGVLHEGSHEVRSEQVVMLFVSRAGLFVAERCVIPSVLRVQWLHNGSEVINVLGKAYTRDEMTNVTPAILSKVGRHLHHRQNHPLKLLREKVQEFVHANYRNRWGGPMFAMLDRISPVVTVEQNFDSLLVPEDHVSRSRSDNYYINSEFVLRAHTSAHERDLIKSGLDAFMVTGDVYRRDEIDRTHYPVFHQMEGARMFTRHELFADYEVQRSVAPAGLPILSLKIVHQHSVSGATPSSPVSCRYSVWVDAGL